MTYSHKDGFDAIKFYISHRHKFVNKRYASAKLRRCVREGQNGNDIK